MSVKQNLEYIKEELSSEEKLLESVIKAERWYSKYKIFLLGALFFLFFGFLGYQTSLWYQQKQMVTHYTLYQELLQDKNNTQKREALKASGSPLYDVFLLAESVSHANLALLQELQNSKDGFIRLVAQYQYGSLSQDAETLDKILSDSHQSNAFKELALFQKAYIFLKEEKIQEAHALLAKIPIDSPLKGMVRFFEHYGITKTSSHAIKNEEVERIEGIEIFTPTPQKSQEKNNTEVELFSGAKSKEQ